MRGEHSIPSSPSWGTWRITPACAGSTDQQVFDFGLPVFQRPEARVRLGLAVFHRPDARVGLCESGGHPQRVIALVSAQGVLGRQDRAVIGLRRLHCRDASL